LFASGRGDREFVSGRGESGYEAMQKKAVDAIVVG